MWLSDSDWAALSGTDGKICCCIGVLVALSFYLLHRWRQDVVPMPNVAFMTDVEGNWEYFVKCLELSPALQLLAISDDGAADIELRPGWHFVFGGDSVDKGGAVGGSIRVVKSLVRLKKRYPQRVHLVLGNRDLNKMRLTSELAPSQLAELHSVPGMYWVAEAKRVSPAGYLRATVAKARGVEPGEVDEAALRAANTPAARLRWMLKETMGADGEFERRRAELALLRRLEPEQVRISPELP